MQRKGKGVYIRMLGRGQAGKIIYKYAKRSYVHGGRVDDEGEGEHENVDGTVTVLIMRHGRALAVLWRRTCHVPRPARTGTVQVSYLTVDTFLSQHLEPPPEILGGCMID